MSHPYLHIVETSARIRKTSTSLAIFDMNFFSVSVCCCYTMSRCVGAVSLRGSNGWLIRLSTMSFQPTTDVHESRKLTSPFQPLGPKPISSYCLIKIYTFKRLAYFSVGGGAGVKKNRPLMRETMSPRTSPTLWCTRCRVFSNESSHKNISARSYSINVMPDGTKFNLPKWT